MSKKEEVRERIEHALSLLQRAKSGAPMSTEGDGPINEWVAIGAAKAALNFTLQSLGKT